MANPVFTIHYEGFRNDDTEDALNEKPQATCAADIHSPVGVYDIVVAGGDADNYELSYTNGKLTVTSAAGVGTLPSDSLFYGKAYDIYSLTGQIIRKGARSLDGLPSGIYVVNGKKVVVE